jgi:hypothetical protein
LTLLGSKLERLTVMTPDIVENVRSDSALDAGLENVARATSASTGNSLECPRHHVIKSVSGSTSNARYLRISSRRAFGFLAFPANLLMSAAFWLERPSFFSGNIP